MKWPGACGRLAREGFFVGENAALGGLAEEPERLTGMGRKAE
jgi:hypothetical protein